MTTASSEDTSRIVAADAKGQASYAFHQLCILGAALAILTALTPVAFKAWGDLAYIALTVPAAVLTLIATRVAERTSAARALWLIVGLAAVLRLGLLLIDPLLSTDIYRYVWDGKVQASGVNPYRYVPADPALALLRDQAIYPNINRADYATTIYPPVAQFFFFAITRLGESVTVMRIGLVACEIATACMIVLLLGRIGRPATRVVAYLWHPLPMWEIANSGHVDALMMALLMAGLWLAVSGRPIRGAVVITLSALVKPFAILGLAAIWRLWDWRVPLLAAAVVAVCYLPYLAVGAGVFGFLTTGYLSEEALSSGDAIWPLVVWRTAFGAHRADIVVYLIVAALVLVALALIAANREPRSAQSMLADINRLLLAFLLLLSPNYPWYFLAIAPFVALRGAATTWAASICALLLQNEVDWDADLPALARKSMLYGGVVAAFAYSVWSSQRGADRRRL